MNVERALSLLLYLVLVVVGIWVVVRLVEWVTAK
jgi:flagellar biogenesis protein FliO